MNIAYPEVPLKYTDFADLSASPADNGDTVENAQAFLASQLAGLNHKQAIDLLRYNSTMFTESQNMLYGRYQSFGWNSDVNMSNLYATVLSDSTDSEELDGDECIGYNPQGTLRSGLLKTATISMDVDFSHMLSPYPPTSTTENIFRAGSNKSPEAAFSDFCGLLLKDVPTLGKLPGDHVVGDQSVPQSVEAENPGRPELVGGWPRERYFIEQQEINDRYHRYNSYGDDNDDKDNSQHGSGFGNGDSEDTKSRDPTDSDESSDKDDEPLTPPSRKPWKSKLFPDGKIPISKLVNPIPPWEITHRGRPLSPFAVRPTLRVRSFCHVDPYCILPDNHDSIHKHSLDEGDHGDTDFQLVSYLDDIGKRPVPFIPLRMLRIPNGITLKDFPTEDTRTVWVYEQGADADNAYTPRVYRHHRSLVRRNPDHSITSLRRDGLCPYCKPTDVCQIMGFSRLFFNVQTTDYQNHLAYQHGLFPNGTRIKDPSLYGWGRNVKFVGGSNGHRLKITFSEGLICPYDNCRQSIRVMPFLRNDPQSNRLLGYLRHCVDHHQPPRVSSGLSSATSAGSLSIS